MKNIKSISQGLVGSTIIIAAIYLGINRLDHGLMLQFLGQVNALHLAFAAVAIITVMALSTVRFAYINNKFGGNENWLFLHSVNMLSLLYAQIALPLIAQIIGRISHGSKEQRIYYAPLTVLEKSFGFAIMIIFGGTASFTLLNQNIIPEGLFQALTLMGVSIVVVLGCGLMLFFDSAQREQFLQTILKVSSIGIFSILSFSVLIQLGILLIYTVLALQFVPDASLITLVGGFAIVVLVTSIPIGFGSWGIREAAAAGVFITLGMPAEIGVLVGLLYGFMHLIILGLSVAILPRQHQTASPTSPISNPFAGANFWPLTALLIMALLPFQIRMPLSNGLITINSVDLIVLIVMINFLLMEFIKGKLKSIWTDQLVWAGLFCLILMIMIGWIVGWLRFGSNEWATANRLMGLIPVMSYLFAGAAMRRYITADLMAKFALLFTFSMVMTVLVKLVSFNLFSIQSPIFFNWSNYLNGFIADRNAFSFMAGMSAVLLVMHFNNLNTASTMKHMRWAVILLSVLMTFVVYTGSRTGIGAASVLLLVMAITMPRILPLTALAAVLTVIFIIGISSLGTTDIQALDGRPISALFSVSTQRYDSVFAGILLSDQYKIFGGGLGAGIQKSGLVIHNLYIWIMGEMGIVGVALCIPMAIAFFRTIMHRITASKASLMQNKEIHGILIFILICGGFSLFQDIAYQRALWLVVGFIMARPFQDKQIDRT